MYGTTSEGGPNINYPSDQGGMVWEITVSGGYKDLHDFGGILTNANGTRGQDGYGAHAGVTLDSGGNIYGTAQGGGSNTSGMVWEITASGAYLARIIHGPTY